MTLDAHHEAPEPTDDLVNEISAEVDCDPRSVVRRLARLPVRGRVQRRIDASLARRGLLDAR